MKAKILRSTFPAVIFLSILSFSARQAFGQAFNISPGTFSATNVCQNSASPVPGCQVLTNGSPNFPTILPGGILQLNSADYNQHASAWFITQQPLASGFTTSFQFQITSTGSPYGYPLLADGLALVIQNDPAGTASIGYDGPAGQEISYGDGDQPTNIGPGQAILNSFAVELDTYQNAVYGDPDGNHIAVQSCGPNNASMLSGNSADHTYICPDGKLAELALASLTPFGLSLGDGNVHTITVNYIAPGTCTSACNNFTVYMDSTQILQATVDLTAQLYLTSGSYAYIGLTSSTGNAVENNDIISWSFSQLPLEPITINQPLQPTVTNFNYSSTVSSTADYSQSGLPGSDFQGLIMQGTSQPVTDSDFANLVFDTPFQGSSCIHQDISGSGTYSCLVTIDLCTTPTDPNPTGANCPNTGQNVTIGVTNTFNGDPSQKPFVGPAYLMGKDTALQCPVGSDNTCKGLVNIFGGINGDAVTVNGKTNNFNSMLVPIVGAPQPQTSITTLPLLNQSWTNQSVSLTFNSKDIVPPNNSNPLYPLPTVANINYSVAGKNVPSPAAGMITGATGSIVIPGTAEGITTVTFYGTDTAGTPESVITTTGSGNNQQVSSAPPTLTIMTDLTPPTASCLPAGATSGWMAIDVTYNCMASDGGSGLANSAQSSFVLSTAVPINTESSSAGIAAVSVLDVAGNSTSVGPYGPFEVDKKAPVISGPTISPASPTYGQSVTGNYSCADGGSGVTLCGPTGSSPIPPTPNTGSLSSAVDGSVGTHTFTVNSQDLVGNITAPSSVMYTVGKATPTVTFTGAPATANQGAMFTVATTTNASTTAVITAAGACSISGNTVTMTSGSGTCLLTANWAADNNYLAATATQSTQAQGSSLTISPASVNFGTPFIFTNSKQTITLTNTGSSTITINSVKLTTADADDWTLVNLCGSSLNAGKSCSLVLSFFGDEVGIQTATITITDNAPNSPQTVGATVNVIAPAGLLTPFSVNFGKVKSGTTATQTLTLTNVGLTTLTVNSIAASGTGFTQTNNCPSSLGVYAKCTITVKFAPTSKTSYSGTVTVLDNGLIGKQVSFLTGTGN